MEAEFLLAVVVVVREDFHRERDAGGPGERREAVPDHGVMFPPGAGCVVSGEEEADPAFAVGHGAVFPLPEEGNPGGLRRARRPALENIPARNRVGAEDHLDHIGEEGGIAVEEGLEESAGRARVAHGVAEPAPRPGEDVGIDQIGIRDGDGCGEPGRRLRRAGAGRVGAGRRAGRQGGQRQEGQEAGDGSPSCGDAARRQIPSPAGTNMAARVPDMSGRIIPGRDLAQPAAVRTLCNGGGAGSRPSTR